MAGQVNNAPVLEAALKGILIAMFPSVDGSIQGTFKEYAKGDPLPQVFLFTLSVPTIRGRGQTGAGTPREVTKTYKNEILVREAVAAQDDVLTRKHEIHSDFLAAFTASPRFAGIGLFPNLDVVDYRQPESDPKTGYHEMRFVTSVDCIQNMW